VVNLNTNPVSDAINRFRENFSPPNVHFGERIPQDLLDNAISKFAKRAGDEMPLMLVPSTGSAKAGFLLTDKALYFGEALGSAPARIRWDEIIAVERDRKLLQVKALHGGIKWDLTGTLLWERGRKGIADIIVGALETILNDEFAAASAELPSEVESSATDGTAVPRQSVTVRSEEASLDWHRLLWFHTPLVLIGGCLVLPILYDVLADVGAFGLASSRISAKGSDRILLGLLSIAPVVYAFGTTLKFSFGRFAMAVILLAFLQATIALRSAALGVSVLPITLGGGIVGIGLGFAIGHFGIKLQSAMRRASVRRLAWIAGIVIVGGVVLLEARDQYRLAQYNEEVRARMESEAAMRAQYWQALFTQLTASNSPLDTTRTPEWQLNEHSLTVRWNSQVDLVLSQTPCVTVKFRQADDRLPYMDRLLADKTQIEERLGPTLQWAEPRKERVYAGAGVSQREVANLPGYWSNGKLWNCLTVGDGENAAAKDQSDWSRQHTWMVSQIDALSDILESRLGLEPDSFPSK